MVRPSLECGVGAATSEAAAPPALLLVLEGMGKVLLLAPSGALRSRSTRRQDPGLPTNHLAATQ